ncbi:hypothetical protein WMW72_17535 [Paenibacillus filicis]|uniref:Uncharacterized protein n=1 Tax=Paenibacillus filicis TaxID=669464 RepID=A0ABU9DLI2_9BACL
MINAQRWSVIILFVIFIIVMVWGNRHWEQSIRQQGARPASAANQPLNSAPVKAADTPSVSDQQQIIPPVAPSQTGGGNTVTLPGGNQQGSETKPPSPPKTEAPPVQKQGTGEKTNTKTTTAVTKSVYQR